MEKDYLVENLSLLLTSGIDVLSALSAIRIQIRSPKLRKKIEDMQKDIDAGASLSKAFANAHLFAPHVISLLRVGEESGTLPQNLKTIAIQQQKDRVLKSKLKSAVMYPLFILTVTIMIGVGVAWFILPNLATVFLQLRIPLPLITKMLIGAGLYLKVHGIVAVPLFFLFLIGLFYLIFIYDRTKSIGERILFRLPGFGQLIQEVELSRFGYILGNLLSAGLPVVSSLESLNYATTSFYYKRLYLYLQESVGEGNSFAKSFSQYPHLLRIIPAPIQELIIASEKSGKLSETLIEIGQNFEEKVDTTTKNLATILEPVLLVIVWLGVVGVAIAVYLPIYSLIGGFNANP